jgi:hypothetical protein
MSVILKNLVKDHHIDVAIAKLVLKDWEIKPIKHNGKKVGEYMLQNNEVHFALEESARLKLGRKELIKSTLQELLSGREFLVTKLFKDDNKSRKLIEFFGFVHTHSDEKFDYFWMNKGDAKCLH